MSSDPYRAGRADPRFEPTRQQVSQYYAGVHDTTYVDPDQARAEMYDRNAKKDERSRWSGEQRAAYQQNKDDQQRAFNANFRSGW